MIMDVMEIMRGPGLWWSGLGQVEPRPALIRDGAADVVIVGAGLTGLWTAYYLRAVAPELSVVVLERELAGYGASGRNGGWCSGELPSGPGGFLGRHGRDAAVAMQRAAFATVAEVQRVAAAEGIDCRMRRGGTRLLALNHAQAGRLSRLVQQRRALGFGPEDYRLLDRAETIRHIAVPDAVASLFTPHCATLDPVRLARGLATAVERRGGVIHERTPVHAVDGGRVRAGDAVIEGGVVVLATEAYTCGLPGARRRVAPIHSHMIATEPLPADVWRRLGWDDGAAVADQRWHFAYLQRTADDRIAVGGRGISYGFGSRVSPHRDHAPAIWRRLYASLVSLFPRLAGVTVTHRWGGPLALARSLEPAAGLDRRRRLAWAGGYGGDGVAMSNLAGRTLAHLIAGVDASETRLPWVGGFGRRWEPEPLRWLGIQAGSALAHAADLFEDRTGRRLPVVGRLLEAALG
ncbi:NAD(P)/FAD-dependent oxidoreductase [Thermoactinospora rubra]|uniref:NAD(P)/FAD-dependent oxidoreductase n=1 Tax=Thermoactinospora rubra TaxID=1088767 RepID=UPI00197E9108|nr:FAD-dependent oxidoreductase [Thermoactinospora rubra]